VRRDTTCRCIVPRPRRRDRPEIRLARVRRTPKSAEILIRQGVAAAVRRGARFDVPGLVRLNIYLDAMLTVAHVECSWKDPAGR
jgi:hypothetical protein